MNTEQIKQAQESIIALEEFLATFNSLLANIDKTIEEKVQKALEGKSIPQTNIEEIIDERVKLGLANFFKLSLSQLQPVTEQITLEDITPEVTPTETTSEQVMEEPNEEIKEETQEEKPKHKPTYYAGSPKRRMQQVIVVDVLKKHKNSIIVKDLVQILKEEHGITWSNPTNELAAIMKRYPVEKVGYGEYKYVGEE